MGSPPHADGAPSRFTEGAGAFRPMNARTCSAGLPAGCRVDLPVHDALHTNTRNGSWPPSRHRRLCPILPGPIVISRIAVRVISNSLEPGTVLSKSTKKGMKTRRIQADLHQNGPFQTQHSASRRPHVTQHSPATGINSAICSIPAAQISEFPYPCNHRLSALFQKHKTTINKTSSIGYA